MAHTAGQLVLGFVERLMLITQQCRTCGNIACAELLPHNYCSTSCADPIQSYLQSYLQSYPCDLMVLQQHPAAILKRLHHGAPTGAESKSSL